LSRKIKGSKNYEKERLRLATAYEKIRNRRKNYLQKLTTKIIKENDIICIEDLNVKGLCKNHKLAAALFDTSFYRIRRMIKYKCEWYGRQFIVVDRWFASSKICHFCGYKNKSMALSVREWECPSCGFKHDRDINASINIRDFSIRNVNTDGISGFQACGEKSAVSRNRKRSFSMNQEEDNSIHKMTNAKKKFLR
jgi:putative transposase